MGTLIVFEGAEGAGKSTQASRLAAWFASREISHVLLREPGGTALGEEIRRFLLDPATTISAPAEALLFLASRAQLLHEQIRPALDSGAVVILDRFFLSTYAYQIAGRGLDALQIVTANQLATGGLVPDLTLVLDLPTDAGLSRADARGVRDRMEQEAGTFHERVRTAFCVFATPEWQTQHPEVGDIRRVDAAGSQDEVFNRIRSVIEVRFPAFVTQDADDSVAQNALHGMHHDGVRHE